MIVDNRHTYSHCQFISVFYEVILKNIFYLNYIVYRACQLKIIDYFPPKYV